MDVIAVGLSDGRVVLHNIRYDEKIVEFKQDWGPVTALTFRTGTIRFSNYLVTSRNVKCKETKAYFRKYISKQ